LDLYKGSVDPSNQVHDFDPGITPYPGGLFWTVPNPTVDSISLGRGTAHMAMTDLALTDFFDIPNALFRFENPVSSPAKCSFDIHWNGPVTSRGRVTASPGSTGELIMSNATMTWSASNALGFSFVSNPSGTSSFFAQLGHVQNGVFAE
jgi:hypothetical protein